MAELTPEQIAELQNAYRDLINYQAEDPSAPIDPMAYRAADEDRLIHIAAYRGDLKTVKLLLDAGEDVNAKGDMGATPAHYAAMGRHRQVFDLIVRRGADTTITDEFGNTPEKTWASPSDKGPQDR